MLAGLISCTICSRESVLYITLGFWWSAGNFGVSWLSLVFHFPNLYMYVCVYTHTLMCSVFGSDGKESACNAGDPDLIPGLGRSPGGGHDTHSSIAWRIPWTEEPGALQFMGLQRVGHD